MPISLTLFLVTDYSNYYSDIISYSSGLGAGNHIISSIKSPQKLVYKLANCLLLVFLQHVHKTQTKVNKIQ